MSDWLGQNKVKVAFYSLIITNILVWGFYFSQPDGGLHLKIYDVGQGDSIFIRTSGGYKILIDGGPDGRVIDYLGKDLPFYSKKIDLVVLTHPQADHLTGLIQVVKRYQVENLWVSQVTNTTRGYEAWQQAIKQGKLKVTTVHQGKKLQLADGTKIAVLWPTSSVSSRDLNAHSVVLLISYGSFDALLTGDADKKAQPYTSSSSHVEVFKVPHHGSKTALNEYFVKSISPEASIISVGKKNNYGHPNENVINFLENIGSKVYRTDKNGTVEIVTDGNSWYTQVNDK